MAFSSSSSKPRNQESINSVLQNIVDSASWLCALVLVAFILLTIFRVSITSTNTYDDDHIPDDDQLLIVDENHQQSIEKQYQKMMLKLAASRIHDQYRPACDEIYVVGEGETLHTISDKCGDPFIVEQNPHIHDPDDVFPGLVIKITPSLSSTTTTPTNIRKLLLR